MSELFNFPFKNQLNAPTFDGRPDENAHMNCLCADIAAGLQYYNHKEYEPDQVKDVVYGEKYTGGTAAVMDVSWCAKQGVRLYSISGNTSYLVEQVHKHLALGHPVIGTIPSTYQPPQNPFDPGMSHCIIFYKDYPGTLTAMNPWKAFAQAESDRWWADRFCYGSVWVMEKLQENKVNIPQGWKDDGKTLTAPNGVKVVLGFRNYILAQPNYRPDNPPLKEEYSDGAGHSFLICTFDGLVWDQKYGVRPVELGKMFAAEVLHAQAAEKRVSDVEAQNVQLAKVNDQLNQELDAKPAPSLPPVSIQSANPVPSLPPAPEDLKSRLHSLIDEVLTLIHVQ